MRKLIIGALGALLMILGFVGGAQAEPGPNGNNDHGLCTAYFNGQKNGHGHGEDQDNQPPPFQGLEDASRTYTDNDGVDNDDDGTTDEKDDPATPANEGENSELTDAENIFNYCSDNSVIGGNPAHGRFTCSNTLTSTGPDDQSDPECNENEKPGKGDDKA